jgi:hypothetical protein
MEIHESFIFVTVESSSSFQTNILCRRFAVFAIFTFLAKVGERK